MSIGRPSKFSPQLANTILARLSGGESLSAICRDPDLRVRNTVLAWNGGYVQTGGQFKQLGERTKEIRVL
jgi:hypothetical protein